MISCIKRHNNYEEELAKPYERLELKTTKATYSLIIDESLGYGKNIYKSCMIQTIAQKILQLKQKMNWMKMINDLLYLKVR